MSILQQLLVAGNETTTKMLTEMVRLLAEHPDEWQQVQRDPSRIDRVVEETDRDHLKEHLAFGKGIHFCLGAALSRLEGRVALQELARRLDALHLPAASNQFTYFPSFLLRGLTRLDLEFTARQEVPA